LKYTIKLDRRGLFVKGNEIEIYGYKAFAYLVLNPQRRGHEISKVVTWIPGIHNYDNGIIPENVR
jgi:hypothetical protein